VAFIGRQAGILSATKALALVALPSSLLLCASVFAAPPQGQPPSQEVEKRDAELKGRRLELRGKEDTLETSQEQRRRMEAEITSIRADRAKLAAALIEATQNVNASERRVVETEARLDTLTGTEDAIKRSLASRRALIAEVLASLQRMGRKPPPALLVSPEDMLAAIRVSMLLGAVLPQMRSETEALASDLADLVQLRQSIATERETLSSDTAKLHAERERLSALVDARQSALKAAEQALSAERERAAELAKQAASLKELIARMEGEIGAAAKAAEAARKADEDHQRTAALAPGGGPKTAPNPFKDSARLAPETPFSQTKGLLPFPVTGNLQRGFGSKDQFGGTEKGMVVATRAAAIVASPCDGWVSFGGSYRSYGQLLIINAGEGYYVVLAGMSKINVNVGQFILAGEPVAIMGDGSVKTVAAFAIGAPQPTLYIEFRKDGVAIDPGPWWAKPELEKVRG